MQELAEEWRATWLKLLPKPTEELMDKYFEGEELTERGNQDMLCVSVLLSNEIILAICGSAFKNKGVQR